MALLELEVRKVEPNMTAVKALLDMARVTERVSRHVSDARGRMLVRKLFAANG